MKIEMTYHQMIAIFLTVAALFFLINVLYPQYGPWVTMGVMITIFVIYKLHSWSKTEEEE